MSTEPLLDSTGTSSPTSARLLRAMLIGHPAAHGVEILVWPDDAERRAGLSAAETPAFLLVVDDVEAPDCEFLEEWTRLPAPMDDVYTRLEMLRARASCTSAPRLRPGGVVEYGSEQLVIPTGQLAIAQLLIERFGTVVKRSELAAAYEAGGGKPTDDALKAAVFRFGQRVSEIGLELRTIRAKGFLLEGGQGCAVSRPSRVTNP